MKNRYLKPIYEELYSEEFSYDSFESRMKMQKAVYLLQEMGVAIGEYDFMWYKHGPYSQTLQDDMYAVNKEKAEVINFSVDAKHAIHELKDILSENGIYAQHIWAECLASLHYLKENIFSSSISEEELANALEKRKPHLNNKEKNQEAINDLKSIFS